MENITKISKRAFPFLCVSVSLLSFVQFLLFYIPSDSLYENLFFIYTASYVTEFLEALFSPLAAMVIFMTRGGGVKNKILPCILISFLRLFYSLPYYYVYYVSDVFNSAEALMLSLLVSFLFLAFFFLQTFVCILILKCIENRNQKQIEDRKYAKLFDFDDHTNFGIILTVIFVFVISFIREGASTVQYLVQNLGSYRTKEIITIVLSYLILFLFAFIHYLIITLLKNKLVK